MRNSRMGLSSMLAVASVALGMPIKRELENKHSERKIIKNPLFEASYGNDTTTNKQWLIDRNKTIYQRKIEAHEWNKKNYYGKILTRTGRPIL